MDEFEATMDVKQVAIIGAGTMGHGIAQVFAQSGIQCILMDNDAKVLGSAMERIKNNLDLLLEHDLITDVEATGVPTRIQLTSSVAEAASGADFIIESVFEDLTVKHEVLQQLEKHCAGNTIIASNTSSFCVRDMAVESTRPERFLVTHFWNPPYLMPLVEVVPGECTAPEAVETTLMVLELVGKRPALVRKDVPGFVGNRLQHALRREAISLVAEGIATPEDVDLIARLSFGLRMPVMGPLETVDRSGLDLTLAIQTYLLPELDRSIEPSRLIYDKIARGELGVKTGKGFFDWSSNDSLQATRQRDKDLLALLASLWRAQVD